MRRFFCSALLMMISSVVAPDLARASSQGPGLVSEVHVMASGVVLFHLSGSRTALPTCGATTPTRWAFDAKTSTGQARLSLLLTAWASGKSIVVFGTDNCPDWADTESVNYFHTVN